MYKIYSDFELKTRTEKLGIHFGAYPGNKSKVKQKAIISAFKIPRNDLVFTEILKGNRVSIIFSYFP